MTLAYEISKNEHVTPLYAGDLKQVRQVVRTIPRDAKLWARITLVDVPSDKQAVLQLLNGQKPEQTPIRKWRLSARGRLIAMNLQDE